MGKPYMSASDARELNDTFINFGTGGSFGCGPLNLLSAIEPRGYNSGSLGWNYDIYDFNGCTIIAGDRCPVSDYQKNYSKEILEDVCKRARDFDSKYNWTERKVKLQELLKEFTDSVKAGIKSPDYIKSFSKYSRELYKQSKMHPDWSVEKASELCDKYVIDGIMPSGITVKEDIKKGLEEAASLVRDSNFSEVPQKEEDIKKAALNFIIRKEARKEEEIKVQVEAAGNNYVSEMKNILPAFKNNPYAATKEILSRLKNSDKKAYENTMSFLEKKYSNKKSCDRFFKKTFGVESAGLALQKKTEPEKNYNISKEVSEEEIGR